MQEYPINKNLMMQNMEKERIGVVPQVDIVADLHPKPEYDVDSWFVIGHFEADGHQLNYLFHIMALKMPLVGKVYQSVLSVFDETENFYYGKDYILKKKDVQIAQEGLSITLPTGSISGTWNRLQVYVKDQEIEINSTLSALHYPLLTRGSSVFEALGMTIHQYSIPYMRTEGTMMLKGEKYDITDTGYTWFDRQWQYQDMKQNTKWSWFAIYMDNGDVLSVFDTNVKGKSFVSILKTDGSMQHSLNVPLFSEIESEYWTSPTSKQTYPTHWKLNLPDFDAELEITPLLKEQEIVSVMKPLHKYEAVSQVSGTYLGNKASGRAVVELIGTWNSSSSFSLSPFLEVSTTLE